MSKRYTKLARQRTALNDTYSKIGSQNFSTCYKYKYNTMIDCYERTMWFGRPYQDSEKNNRFLMWSLYILIQIQAIKKTRKSKINLREIRDKKYTICEICSIYDTMQNRKILFLDIQLPEFRWITLRRILQIISISISRFKNSWLNNNLKNRDKRWDSIYHEIFWGHFIADIVREIFRAGKIERESWVILIKWNRPLITIYVRT